ncbi:MAG: transglutaminase-like domain-containing protein [Candidatus Micrarchaeota archaeon]|nr:transglutaminase-like domain-containing protein [Candidatus Micrarchaeota archaeon]
MNKLYILGLLFIGLLFAGCCGVVPDVPNDDNSKDTTLRCTDGTAYGTCSYNQPQFCNLGYLVNDTVHCGCPEGQVVHGTTCGFPRPVKEMPRYNFTFYENTEPYLSAYCTKIDPYDLSVRKAAADAIRKDPGSYSFDQLFDIYDWVKENIIYQNVPLAGIPYPSSETLITKSGDCKNQAVLIASMVNSIGGTSKVVADPACVHAYAIVYFGSTKDLSSFTNAVTNHYGSDVSINYFTLEDGIWVIFDPAGGSYPGDTLPACSGDRTAYFITSCLDCANTYPNEPYTFDNKCYSQCPSGTIASSEYVCASCQEGYYSCNNECLACPSGYYLATNCRCYRN